jgi:hypothetical protein
MRMPCDSRKCWDLWWTAAAATMVSSPLEAGVHVVGISHQAISGSAVRVPDSHALTRTH